MTFLKKICILLVIATAAIWLSGCKKYLDAKSDQRFEIPQSVQDMQALLDDYFMINQRNPSAGEVSSDDYYLIDNDFDALTDFDRRKYTWNNERQFPRGTGNDWSFAYENVYKANLVLDNIDDLERTPGDQQAWESLKGHA